MSIHEDAFRGTLTLPKLQDRLALDPSCLTRLAFVPGGPKAEMTPLALAIAAGRLEVVKLLLKESSSPPDLSRGSERYSPLYYAITRAPQNSARISIVKALLEAGADIMSCSSYDDDYTPLMFAISYAKDAELIHTLIDHDPSQNLKEERGGKTAVGLAKEVGLEKELLPKDKRLSNQGENVYWFLAVLMVLFMYARTAFQGVAKEFLEVPQVKSAVGSVIDKFKEDLNIAMNDIGEHVGKGATKFLETQRQVNGKKPAAPAKAKAPRPKPTTSTTAPPASGGLFVPTMPTMPNSVTSTPVSALVPLPGATYPDRQMTSIAVK